MYVRTEDGAAVNFNNDEAIDVKPGEGSSWQLVAANAADSTEICIATFDKVNDANKARESLSDAIENNKAWDANEFKEKLKLSPGIHFTVAKGRRGRF